MERHGLALQFHLEVTARGLERWYLGHAVEITATPGLSVTELRTEATQYAGRTPAASAGLPHELARGAAQTGRGDQTIFCQSQTTKQPIKDVERNQSTKRKDIA